MVGNELNDHVPFSICVDAAVGATHFNMLGLNCGYVGIVIVLFVLSAAVGATMGGGFVIRSSNTSFASSIILLLLTARALSSIGLLLVLSALIQGCVVVETTPPVMTEH